MTQRVVILQETMPEYRVKLFERIINAASEHDIAVEVVYGHALGARGRRIGGGSFPAARVVRNRYLRVPGTSSPAVWQPAIRRCLRADLVVVEQANRLLINYVLLAAQRSRGPKVAFWGHGRNLQASSTTRAERIKARVALAPSWWFAYTDGVAEHLANLGVARDHTTVVGNAVDVVGLREAVELQRSLTPATSRSTCVYLGGLYEHKRLDLLFEASDLLAARVPGFNLRIAGEGEMRPDVEAFVATRPWAEYLGKVSGDDHARLLASARLLLIPGLVGLVILDSFAAGVPLVTTADALHSPEIEYLQNGVNGVISGASLGPEGYAVTVASLLNDPPALVALSEGAQRSAGRHTVEGAAMRFTAGLVSAVTTG